MLHKSNHQNPQKKIPPGTEKASSFKKLQLIEFNPMHSPSILNILIDFLGSI